MLALGCALAFGLSAGAQLPAASRPEDGQVVSLTWAETATEIATYQAVFSPLLALMTAEVGVSTQTCKHSLHLCLLANIGHSLLHRHRSIRPSSCVEVITPHIITLCVLATPSSPLGAHMCRRYAFALESTPFTFQQ